MATEDSTIFWKIEVDPSDAVMGMDKLAERIELLKQKQDEIDEKYKEGSITLQQYTEYTRQNTAELKKSETAQKNLTTATKEEANSINALTAQNKELIKERNALNLSTVEGRKRLDEINLQLDKNNQRIKDNVSGLEKQRLNIGNYRSALEGIAPGLGGMSDGVNSITAGAKAFTATPFGATLQVIAGLLVILKDAFGGSEQGQRSLNKVTQVTTALFSELSSGIRQLGEWIISAFENPKQTMLDLVDFLKNNIINRFKAFGVIIEGIKNLDFKQVANGALQLGTGVENVIGKVEEMGKRVMDVANKAIEQGNRVAKLQADIEDFEDEANLRRAKNDLQVAKLRERAIKEEGDVRRKTIEEAIKLEKQSAIDSVKLAEMKVNLAKAELATAKDKKAATDALEEAEVNLVKARTEEYNATIKFQKEIERLDDEKRKKDEDAAKKEEERKKKEAKDKEEAEKKRKEDEKKAFEDKLKQLEAEDKLDEAKLNKLKEERLAVAENEQEKLDIEREFAELAYNARIKELDAKMALYSKDSVEYKNYLAEKLNAEAEYTAKTKGFNDQQEKFDDEKLKKLVDTTKQTISLLQSSASSKQQILDNELKAGKISQAEFDAQSKRIFERNKKLNIATTIIDTLANATRTFASQIRPGDPVSFAIATALSAQVLATGLARVQAIKSTNYDSGGSVSVSGSRSSGVTATQATTNPINQTFSAANAFKNMPPVIASWREATEVRNRVEFKEALTTV